MKKIFCCFFLLSCARGFTGEDTGDGGASQQSTVSQTTTSVDVGTSSSTSEQTGTAQDSSTSGMLCVPGSTQLCNGPGACVGAQSCNQDGMGFSDCVCGDQTTAGVTIASSTGGGNFTCDPLSPGAVCGPGKQCIPQSNSDPICSTAGYGNMFDLCIDFSQCLPGLDCVNDGVNSCCMAWCRLGYNDCPNGFSCVEVLGNPSINGQIYGVCWDGYPCVL